MKKFQIISEVIGYQSKMDVTNTDSRFLVTSSQNCIINSAEKVQTRKGYKIDGSANAATDPIESSYDWFTSTGVERNLRSYDDELEVRFALEGADADWYRVANGWAAVDFSFAEWWDSTEVLDLLLFVNGEDKIQEWSGGIAEVASATANTITKKGTTTWAQNRFYSARNRTVIINGTEYAYTGGHTTTTLTGVTPDPSGEAAGSIVIQKVVERDNEPADGDINDVLITFENHLVVGSHKTNTVKVSIDSGNPGSGSGYLAYTESSPRVPGEGATLILNQPTVGFGILNKDLIIFSGKDRIYKTEFQQLEVSTTLTETLNVRELKSGSNRSALERDLIVSVGDSIAFIDHNKQLRLLTSVEQLENPVFKNLSDPIKPDFDAEDFTNGHLKFQDNRFYVTSPVNGKLYIYEVRENAQGEVKAFWQPPQLLPARRIARIDNSTYFHSNGNPETYKLFEGMNDNNLPFKSVAAFSYRSYDDRYVLKSFDEWLTEGYVSANTKITMRLNYDYDGFTQKIEKIIDGADDDILFQPTVQGSLGDDPLGDVPLGGSGEEASSLNPKFRIIHELELTDCFEIQVVYETDGIDKQWEILSQGGNIKKSSQIPAFIKK